jgi:geranyl-CoA carboxylase alpha subunit
MAFTKILIANRGEIACRVQRTARALGYGTVAVYSDADAGALHVALADEAVRIGAPPAAESYLNVAALLDAAARSGADAVHPGYGFLSENAEFAEACERAGLVFIGPPASAIRAMGNKAAAKRLMAAAGVPCVPGYHGAEQSDARLTEEARRIGFPVMVKAAAGGGGRGMRLVTDAAALPQALAGARSEARNAFGSDELILEKAVAEARHVEFQVFGDSTGQVLQLGERDCSIQRRHQKLVEEAPSPAVSPELRARMGAAAVAAAQAVGYRGAGTVEFLLAPGGEFYFLEMNTRLQVEHPVTEAITGLDLVAWQLRIAAGEPLPLRQEQVRLHGHAIEARLCAEDPYRDFLPRSGTVHRWELPAGDGVRVDHGLQSGQEVPAHYDSLLAKVIARGETREEARRRLLAALSGLVVLGIPTNRAFLLAALRHPAFVAGAAHTGFVGAHFAKGSPAMQRPAPDGPMVALAAALLFEAAAGGPQARRSSWRSAGAPTWPVRIDADGAPQAGTVTGTGPERYTVNLPGGPVSLEIVSRGDGAVRFAVDGRQRTARFALADGTLHLDLGGLTAAFRETLLERSPGEERDGDGRLLAPMNGRIVAVLAQAGERVAKGQRIVVLEAMKMQHEIVAGRAGVVESIAVREGDQVATRQLLAALAQE